MSLLDLINQSRAKLQRGNVNRPEKISSDKNLVRILLHDVNGAPQLYQDWGQHFIKDQTGTLKAVYVCTQTNFDEPCAVCDALAEAQARTGDEELLKTLKDARSSKRILVNALYLKGGKHDNPETNPVVLDLPPTVWDAILATAGAFMEEGVNVFDEAEGHNFIIEKTGTGMNTEYKVTPSPKATAIKDAAGVKDKMKDLAAWARQESEAEKAKAVTSVRVISGTMDYASAGAGRAALPAPSSGSRLSAVSADAIDADFVEVPSTKPKVSAADSELDDFLKDL